MSAEAPARADLVGEAVDWLRTGTSVELVGMFGAGRTTALDEVCTALRSDGVPLLRLAGSAALRDRPLAALAAHGLDVVAPPQSPQALQAAVDDLAASLPDAGGAVVAVDDADLLDAASLGVLAALHARTGAAVVAVTRPGRAGRSPATALGLGRVARVELSPLRFDEVHRLIHTLLDGPVDPAAVAALAADTGGLPGLVRAHVDSARRASRLGHRHGTWVLRGELWTGAVAAAVQPYLTDVDEAGHEALTLLAHADGLDLDRLLTQVDPAVVERLDDAGLLHLDASTTPAAVTVFPPLLAQHLVQDTSATRRALVRTRIAALGPHSGDGVLTADDVLADPVALSRRLTRHWRAELEGRSRKWRADPGPGPAAHLLEALLVLRARPHEIEAVVTGTRPDSLDLDARAAWTVWQAVAETAAPGTGPGSPALEDDELDPGVLAVAQARLRTVGHGVPSQAELDALPTADGAAGEASRVVRATAFVARGDAHAALRELDGFTTASATLQLDADVARGLALLYTCELDAAVDGALDRLAGAARRDDPCGIEAHAYVAGLGLSMQGRLVELDRLMSRVLALSPVPAHLGHVQTGLLWLAAEAATWRGRYGYAETLARQAGGQRTGRGPYPGMAPEGVTAELRDTDATGTADELWALAEERLSSGYLPAGIVAGVSAVERRPDPAWAARLADAARRCDAPLMTHLADYAVAIATADMAELAVLEPRLLDAGLRLYAVRTAVMRAVRLLTEGDAQGAAAHADAAWHQAGLRGRDLCGLFRRLDRAVGLTAREREVAVLVARGWTVQQIAQEKVLSVRTVENHVFSACHKVGVNSRDGLARAAQTWLSCAVE